MDCQTFEKQLLSFSSYTADLKNQEACRAQCPKTYPPSFLRFPQQNKNSRNKEKAESQEELLTIQILLLAQIWGKMHETWYFWHGTEWITEMGRKLRGSWQLMRRQILFKNTLHLSSCSPPTTIHSLLADLEVSVLVEGWFLRKFCWEHLSACRS